MKNIIANLPEPPKPVEDGSTFTWKYGEFFASAWNQFANFSLIKAIDNARPFFTKVLKQLGLSFGEVKPL